MNYIKIKDLEIFAFHGVHQEEKKLGQKFIVNCKLGFNTQRAAQTDSVEDTMHYGFVANDIIEAMEKKSYDLIETAVDKVVEKLFDKYQFESIELELVKPWAPIRKHVSSVSVSVNYERRITYIGLGSNVGDSNQYFDRAISAINNLPLTKVVECSDRIETKPYGNIEQDNFLNAVLKIETMLTAEVLLNKLNEIEASCGRTREIKWGPRTLDLDILLYGNEIIHTDRLIVPHPELHLRSFVLTSLVELEQYTRNPLDGSYYRDTLNLLNKE